MAVSKRTRRGRAGSEEFLPELLVSEEPSYYGAGRKPKLIWRDDEPGVWIYQGDSLMLLRDISRKYPNGLFDLIFADPPYFLSNGGITCHAGKMVSVDKGEWDKLPSIEQMHVFNKTWLEACQNVLKPNGTIFVSGTSHVIHSVGFAMQELEFKLLNDIIWIKPNPPPNLSCRYFTHATETILWAAKSKRSKHCFNYALMREMAGGKQMKSVWKDVRWDDEEAQVLLEILPPSRTEKKFGKHPTQKPLHLLERLILAASTDGDMLFDPFLGSGTTGVAAIATGRKFIGCELDSKYVTVAQKRIGSALQESRSSLFA